MRTKVEVKGHVVINHVIHPPLRLTCQTQIQKLLRSLSPGTEPDNTAAGERREQPLTVTTVMMCPGMKRFGSPALRYHFSSEQQDCHKTVQTQMEGEAALLRILTPLLL